MSDYSTVKRAMEAGTPPELICASCPWDRLCITPPEMTGADIERSVSDAEKQDMERDPARSKLPMGMLLTSLMLAGRDHQAQLCPVFTLKLRSPEGRQVAELLRESMRA